MQSVVRVSLLYFKKMKDQFLLVGVEGIEPTPPK